MLYNSCDSQAGVEHLKDTDLQEVLKGYYRLCRQATDKNALIKDATLLRALSSLVVDSRPTIAVYTTKILLSLTEKPEDARLLAESSGELCAQLKKAVSGESQCLVAPRVIRKLFIVQTRLMNAATTANKNNTNTAECPMKKTIFGASAIGSKQLVFSFERPSETQRRAIEQKCIQVQGVVSICFQATRDGHETRCLIRCREGIEAKAIVRVLLRSGGFDMVKQLIRMPNGTTETFDFYADQLELEQEECGGVKELPKYLDDLELFDQDQCIATKEQVETQQQHGAGWLSSLKSMFW